MRFWSLKKADRNILQTTRPPWTGVDCPRYDKTATGLVPFFFTVRSAPENIGQSYTISVRVSGHDEPVFTKEIVADTVITFWLALNSHWIPNGFARVEFELMGENASTLWRESIPLHISNFGRLAERVRESLRRFKTPIVVDGDCNSTFFNYKDQLVTPWFDRENASEHVHERLAKGEISTEEAGCLEQFVQDGYMMLPDLVEPSLIDQINSEIDDAISRRVEGYELGSSQRIHQLHQQYAGIRELWYHPRILRLLNLIFEERCRPCQSLTYVFGSEQSAHQDTIHLTPFPAGYMCGVWTALEDVKPNSGELEVYRGSHRLPRLYRKDVACAPVKNGDWSEFQGKVPPVWKRWIAEGNFERIVYQPGKGSVLIWHENLMHGGSARIDKSLSRRSVVTHNFADGAIAYYDSSGLVGYMEPLENIGPGLARPA